MSDSMWGEAKEIFKRITSLAANVEALLSRVKKNEETIESLKDMVRELKSDIRVSRAENKVDAQDVALRTIISAHEQVLSRIIALENSSNCIPPKRLDHDGKSDGV